MLSIGIGANGDGLDELQALSPNPLSRRRIGDLEFPRPKGRDKHFFCVSVSLLTPGTALGMEKSPVHRALEAPSPPVAVRERGSPGRRALQRLIFA